MLNEEVRWVYFEWKAELLEGVTQGDLVYWLFQERLGKGMEIIEEAKNPSWHQFYKISVSNYYLFDRKESNPSQKYELKWAK